MAISETKVRSVTGDLLLGSSEGGGRLDTGSDSRDDNSDCAAVRSWWARRTGSSDQHSWSRGMWSGDVRRSRFRDEDCREPASLVPRIDRCWEPASLAPRNDRWSCWCDAETAMSRGRSITPVSFSSILFSPVSATPTSPVSRDCTSVSPVTTQCHQHICIHCNVSPVYTAMSH